MVKAFVLKECTKLPQESEPSEREIYDLNRQLWIDPISGQPIVSRMLTAMHASQFGETTLTLTREGVDQSESASLQCSQFGETTHTRTREGIDQSESATLQCSQFGETTITKTQEGVDQTELTICSQFDETAKTATTEDVDAPKRASVPANATHTHF